MEDMCRGAVAKGLPEIGFTEHYDLHPRDNCRDWFKLDAWAKELDRCRALFADKLIIRAGIEIGEAHIFPAETQALLARYPFDYVLGSLHWVGDNNMFDETYFTSRPADAAFRLYFAELGRLAAAGQVDVLSHFDAVVRTGVTVYGEYEPARYEDAIRPVLQTCIARGLALDINTAALRRKIRLLTPGLTILRWYAEMGGARVTLGSDAHRPDHLTADFDTAIATLRAAGLTQVTQYEKRVGTLVVL
jgi:histidinol-phosphatase (PHP family)